MRRAHFKLERLHTKCQLNHHSSSSSSTIVNVRIRRPQTTVTEFSRPAHEHLRFNKHLDAKARGLVKSLPLTPKNIVPTLLAACGVDVPPKRGNVRSAHDATTVSVTNNNSSGTAFHQSSFELTETIMQALDGWELQRMTSYGSGGGGGGAGRAASTQQYQQEEGSGGEASSYTSNRWIPQTRPPMFRLMPPLNHHHVYHTNHHSTSSPPPPPPPAAILHVPPLLSLPQDHCIAVSEYVHRVSLEGQRCSPIGLGFSNPTAPPPVHKEHEIGGDGGTVMESMGVGVILASRSVFSSFVTCPFHDGNKFVSPPIQVVNDESLLPMNATIEQRQDTLLRSLKEFCGLLRASQAGAFQQAGTWWFRVDVDVSEALRLAMTTCCPDMSLDDARWTMLPRTKLLKNAKWIEKPEMMAAEMKYGLLEVFGGASPKVLERRW